MSTGLPSCSRGALGRRRFRRGRLPITLDTGDGLSVWRSFCGHQSGTRPGNGDLWYEESLFMGGFCRVLCGLCYAVRRCRTGRPGQGHRATPYPLLEESAMLSNRRRDGSRAKGQVAAASDEALREWAPDLTDFLTSEAWPDDQGTRVTGTVLIFCEDGAWKACLNDRDAGLRSFVTARTALGLLEAVEARLSDPGGSEWRPPRDNPSARQRRG